MPNTQDALAYERCADWRDTLPTAQQRNYARAYDRHLRKASEWERPADWQLPPGVAADIRANIEAFYAPPADSTTCGCGATYDYLREFFGPEMQGHIATCKNCQGELHVVEDGQHCLSCGDQGYAREHDPSQYLEPGENYEAPDQLNEADSFYGDRY